MNISTNSSGPVHLLLCEHLYLSWNFFCLLTLPVFLFVIGLAIQNCRKSKSSPASHSDVFTFHMSALEVVGITGAFIPFFSYFTFHDNLLTVGENMIYMATFGQTLFHLLVCLERYFAVVHPIVYRRWKKHAAHVRDGSIVAVWLFSFGMACSYHLKNTFFIASSVLFLGLFTLVLITFFCASVLRVLLRPGPGNTRLVDQKKRKAFHTMLFITAALMFKFVTLFFTYMFHVKENPTELELCLYVVSALWFNIPSSLVLPLLLLHRHVTQRRTTRNNPK